jgi:hypothetical protein
MVLFLIAGAAIMLTNRLPRPLPRVDRYEVV